MPAKRDLYSPEDNAWEVERMPNAELRVIPGVWGHFAGGGANPVDTAFIDRGLKDYWQTEPARAREVIVRR